MKNEMVQEILRDISHLRTVGEWPGGEQPKWTRVLCRNLQHYSVDYACNRAMELIAFYLASCEGIFLLHADVNLFHKSVLEEIELLGLDIGRKQ